MAKAGATAGAAGPMVCVAQVGTAHGVRGAVKLRTFTEDPAGVAAYGPLFDERGRELFSVEVLHRVKGGVVARIPGLDSREAADALRGQLLYVPRSLLPEPEDEEEFYHEDLVGLAAFDPGGEALGRVVAVHNFGAGDLLEVRAPGAESVMVPFTREAVPEVDVKAGRVVVVVPPEPG